jgi:hypothetical protein
MNYNDDDYKIGNLEQQEEEEEEVDDKNGSLYVTRSFRPE